MKKTKTPLHRNPAKPLAAAALTAATAGDDPTPPALVQPNSGTTQSSHDTQKGIISNIRV